MNLKPMTELPPSMESVLAAVTAYECVSVFHDEDEDQWFDLETDSSGASRWVITDPDLYFGWLKMPKYSVAEITNE